jgi:hypothetical protein
MDIVIETIINNQTRVLITVLSHSCEMDERVREKRASKSDFQSSVPRRASLVSFAGFLGRAPEVINA